VPGSHTALSPSPVSPNPSRGLESDFIRCWTGVIDLRY